MGKSLGMSSRDSSPPTPLACVGLYGHEVICEGEPAFGKNLQRRGFLRDDCRVLANGGQVT